MEPTPPVNDQSPFAALDPETAAHPQPMYKMLRDSTPVMPVDGVGVVITRKLEADQVFRHPEVFSSNADALDLKNPRPLIPLQSTLRSTRSSASSSTPSSLPGRWL